MKRTIATLVAAGALSACATTAQQGLPPVAVMAKGETAPVGTMNEDAADDPAIWRNDADPAASLIVATDKKAGLYVYGLDGAVRSFIDAGAVNNVDLVTLEDGTVMVAASDRIDLANSHISTFTLDTASGELAPLGRIPSGSGEGYGFCMSRHGGLSALAVIKDGRLREYAIGEWAPGETPQATLLREMAVPSQPEGCVFDDRDGTLYVGEEAAGIWRFRDGETTGQIVAAIDNQYLVADVEGLAIARDGADGGYLIASSQGDNAYAVFQLPSMAPLGRFRVAEGAFGSTEETDGIELDTRSFGPDYPEGLFIAQDGQNGADAQNFKLVSWADVKAALGLD
ncbi:phytase [Alteraurantiacibacter aquimixticola]|uniref:Phytase n=1 Tax=Alteraurantiacibacter aquimixticola TaxID=2489173 RepID=A0A4V4U8H2_9SPHN|nr:phytase [Alteraurantiacibacter aquimixticola]TIX49870.1 phytase [Alteraurantiacibacter aquimixticola]